MKCGLCGYEFNVGEAQVACAVCPLVGHCGLVHCPRCGYEMPPEARLVGWLRRLRERYQARHRRAKEAM